MLRRFPHGATNRPGHPRPTHRYGQLPVRPGPGDPDRGLPLPPELLRWADATARVLTSEGSEVEALWVLDDRV
jgi:hypothetical protein